LSSASFRFLNQELADGSYAADQYRSAFFYLLSMCHGAVAIVDKVFVNNE